MKELNMKKLTQVEFKERRDQFAERMGSTWELHLKLEN